AKTANRDFWHHERNNGQLAPSIPKQRQHKALKSRELAANSMSNKHIWRKMAVHLFSGELVSAFAR
ncbi:hypothetical protein, partial [Roseibium polysiphoniae]|uniref:hypothetical protein n=1 Tax=Roseibium polysiphoniae TaxID=2571221 RepID=UPI001BD00DC7